MLTEACAQAVRQEEGILGAIYAELGIEEANKMEAVPTAGVAAPSAGGTSEPAESAAAGASGGESDALDAELQKRLDNLRRT